MRSILLVLFLACSCLPSHGQLKPSGLYIGLNDNDLKLAAEVLTTEIDRKYATTSGYPTVKGHAVDLDYSFDDWKVEMVLGDPEYKSTATDELSVGWDRFNFTITAHYDACAKGTSFCSSGDVTIQTTAPTQLLINAKITLTTEPPIATVTSASLTGGHIDYHVHCTSSTCWVPTSEVQKGVEDGFVGGFEKAVADNAGTALKKFLDDKKASTEFTLHDGLVLNLESSWTALPATLKQGLLFVATSGGFYSNVSKSVHFPPFTPSFVPPENSLLPVAHGINIVITEYFFHSLTWALGNVGFFDRLIQASDVPAESPVQLKTSDPFFQQVAPGLTSYPNMDLEIITTLGQTPNPAVVIIDTEGLHIWNTILNFEFILYNKTFTKQAWILSNVFNLDLKVVGSIGHGGQDIMFNASLYNFTSAVKVVSSNVGTVSADGFATLYSLLQSQIKIPGFSVKLPKRIFLSDSSTTLYSHYMAFEADYAYKPETAISSPLHPKVPVNVNL